MDIFKGIGDFFGGLFGQKKKREDEQPQQQQSAVSFNSTPKLGDNFANNLSNPTQPQQPKEFAKSSVDLNPVKPVQPVQPQPQPQVNRDQERQQLADKYRQEETDRYNQGSDHAANFLNDIFSGGKTAQMRENTINQNIQNRVNAEMLRKYGPDDQQVKQNIAQTSQNINKNATAVSDFTKNYNNNVQQTVVAPVSAVKGAANSVAEFVPKVSGAITELGANTIKLFDEDNQFANNLIKRVRADREKNIVRKTLNDATGLTDQDNKMAYGLGSSGARMAIDAAMTPVTGGLAPAVVHGVEAHSEMMDHLDNIEARKKAEAAAKGEAYTPSSFSSRYLASTANAGAQAAIEKLGIDNLTGKIGGRFAKNMVGRAITGALGEAGEEAAQQYAENFTKKLFDNKQDIHENVAESALMGGIMGGAGKMAFGGMESVKNPYKNNNMADGEVSISKLHPDQMGYNKDAVLGKFTGDTRKRMSERSFNMLQDLRANNPYVTSDGDALTLSRAGNSKMTRTSTPIPDDLFMAKMRTTPRINQIIENSTKTHSAPDFKNHKIAPDGFNYYNTPVNISGKRYNMGLDVAVNNGNDTKTIYNSNIRKAPDLVSYDANGNDTELKSNAYDSNIAQNSNDVNNIKYKLAEQNKDLLATHTITADKLKATDAMGGAIYPSIAISKPEVFAGENYGDITLVGDKDFIDPKNRQNKVKVFDNDIYSPRVPKPDYKVKNIPNEYKEMMTKTNYDPIQLLNYPKDVIGDGLDSKIYRDSYMANKTGADNIAKVPSDKYSEYLKEDIFNKPEYRDYAKKMHNMLEIEKRLLMGETSAGNAIYKPYTSENILKKMNKSELKGGERPYSLSPDYVYAAEELKNIKAIKNKQDLLQKIDVEKLDQIRDKNRKLADKIEDALGEQGMHFYQIKEKIADYLNTGNTEGLTAKSIALLDAYKQELDSDPRLYFEAKMRRMVGLDEFKKAVIPDNLDDETRAILKNRGVETIEYKAGDNADRMAKLNALDDLKFKKTQAENLVRVAKENLQARHQELTGDQNIAFNEWANELERHAQGFFDEKTGKITINDGDLNTLNHELGHKLLTRADNRAELLADIRNTVGDEALNAKYGENYAQQVANMSPEERANLFAEEYLADGFSDYYNGILAGEDSQRLGAKLGIPPRVLAAYDRIIEAIKGILGLQQDTLKQFYAQAETGKFAQYYKQNTPVYNESLAYKIAQDSKVDLAETDQKTRKFAETVLDTDTPPKDFVKLMHAGDESLKYTPKKNSELWNKATKSVQESPERVFNELENTRVANDETMAKGIALAKHYQAMGDDLKASELYVELAKKATEAGRTVQALSLMRRTTPEGVLMSTMREVENYNDKMKDKPNKQINITPEQRAEFLGKLREAYAMPEGDLKEIRARRIAIGEAIREVRDQIPSSKWDKFTTLWKAGLLTAPTTHIRNIAGNIINGGSEKTAQTVGSAFDWVIGKGTGKRTLTLNGFGGMIKGIKEGSGYAKDIMRTGIDTTGEIDSKWRDQRTNYGNSLGGKLAQGYTDFVFNSLNASDKIFRGSAEKMSIANQAKAIAINEKLKGAERKARIEQLINNPTNAMLENAKHDADMATFQQDTGLGQFVAKGRQAGGITKKATDIIMPFTGVPSAVADQLVNYSPLGVVKGVKQVADLRKAVKNGLDDSTITALQRKASTQLGRGITGTMLLGAGLALANAGLLSGQTRDDNEKRQWAAEGKKANALKIGDTWVPIDTLSPQMILAAAGANAESQVKNGQGVLEAGLNTLGDGAKSWTEQGYMTGIKDAIDTITGDKDLNKYAIQQATSLIPNGIRKTAAAMDNKARQVNYGDLGESMQNAIPLWRNGLPAKYDIYGREIKTNPFSTMLDPQKSSAENPTALSQKINEFRKNNPELDSVIPKTAPNKITINGQTRELTSSERSEYQRLLGENISKYMMSGGFNDSSFNKLSEGDKKDMLEKIQSDVKKSVEMALFNKTSKQTNDNAKKIAQNIVNGGNNELKPEWKTKEQSKDELYKNPELEYERLQAEYDKKKKNGDFDGRKVQELQERMKVRRAQVGKDTPKSYRDMYSSGKQSFNMLLKEMDSDQERNEAMTKVLEYGDKLVAAGLEKKNKFRDKYGNVDFEDSKDKKGRGRGRKSGSSASSVNTADITSTLSKNLLKTRGSQAKALNAMPTISVRNSSLQARAKRSAVRFKK
nr:MAG TPA: nuclease [Caudoviricetes sp.]